jgi:CheY-like chemotaxis protein
LNLPDMHGSDILADIELDDQLRAVPRIIMTTSDEPEDLRRCRRYGYLDYMVKPANYQVLAEKIRDILT